MRKTFAALDDVLIERVFQPASDLMADRFALSRLVASCFCIDVASLAWIVSRASGVSDAMLSGSGGMLTLDAALLLLGLAALVSLRAVFRRTGTRKQANPLRQTMQPHRAVLLLMLASRMAQMQPFGLAGAADLVMLICAAAALYLGACAERPPVRRAWTSRLSATSRV